MPLIDIDGLREQEPAAGFKARFLHTDNMTLAFWTVAAESNLPLHAHLHEQVVVVLEGEFELTVKDQVYRLSPGKAFTIPSDAPHSGRAVTDCRILDVFYPLREDYR